MTESDAHRCATPAEAWPGDEWTCPACGATCWADEQDDGETIAWRVTRPGQAGDEPPASTPT